MLLKSFVAGWGILIVAIILNIIATRIGTDTWWTLLGQAGKIGFVKALQTENPASLIFLFVIYPGLLGLTAYLFFKLVR